MDTVLVILLVVAIVVNVILVIAFFRRKPEGSNIAGEGFKLVMQQVNELSRVMDTKLSENRQELTENRRELTGALQRQFSDSQKQFDFSQKLIRDITNEIAQVKEIGKQSLSVQDQLRDLQDILKNPKHRGILGEYYLETLLTNVLAPGQYQMQYAFKNGEIVDAAIFVKDKIIPVDSKFSLENYNKLAGVGESPGERERLEREFVNDLKNRIQETAKYVRPEEGTMDFAFMFIPHEAIYYDLLVNKIGVVTEETDNLIQRAASKYKVIIVSPTSFLAYLQTVLQGLKALQIEEKAKDIIKRVAELGSHLSKYTDFHQKLGVSLSTVVNHYNNSGRELKKVDKDVLRITGEAPGLEAIAIEKPDTE